MTDEQLRLTIAAQIFCALVPDYISLEPHPDNPEVIQRAIDLADQLITAATTQR